MASISEPFIRRPVGTTLLAIGLFLIGFVAYVFLPVSAVPNVDFPMIRVSASRPGADLPRALPSLPRFRKANPAAAPVFVLALTSKTLTTSAMYDVADTVIAQ